MGIKIVLRVQCDGACRGWLRKGRVAPSHWGEQYAEIFTTSEDAEGAMEAAGWVNGLCPKDQVQVS